MSYPFTSAGYPFGVPQIGLGVGLLETLPGPLIISGNNAGAGVYLFRVAAAAPLAIDRINLLVTASHGNVDGGLYERNGATFSLVTSSGSAAAGAANAVQSLALPERTLAPGTDYYLALAFDDNAFAAGNVGGFDAIAALRELGFYKTDPAFPLPATLALADLTDFGSFYWLMVDHS